MRLKSFMKLRCWTVAELANELGVHRATLYAWMSEPGKIPRRGTLKKLHRISGGLVGYADFARGA
jgi:transcriptional regulator with XRE-family HTH domain